MRRRKRLIPAAPSLKRTLRKPTRKLKRVMRPKRLIPRDRKFYVSDGDVGGE